jgi:hypothetical protein
MNLNLKMNDFSTRSYMFWGLHLDLRNIFLLDRNLYVQLVWNFPVHIGIRICRIVRAFVSRFEALGSDSSGVWEFEGSIISVEKSHMEISAESPSSDL